MQAVGSSGFIIRHDGWNKFEGELLRTSAKRVLFQFFHGDSQLNPLIEG